MKATIDKTFQVNEPIAKVWAFLADPSQVVTCVPGAKLTEAVDEQHYKGTVSLKVGPVVTNFKGDVEMVEVNEADHVLVLSGKGVDAKGKGSATMTLKGSLKAIDAANTEVTTSMEVSVAGRLAQFGSRLMGDISNRMFDQFTSCMTQRLETTDPAPAAEASPAEAAPSGGEAATAVAPAPVAPPPTAAEPEPVKALPLLFSALWAAIKRFFLRLFGRKT